MTAAPEGETSSDYDDALPGAQTELAPSSSATEMHTAWALDDGPEWTPFWTAGRITGLAVVGAVALIAGAVVVGVVKLRHDDEGLPAAPTSTVALIAPPVPPAVTVTTVVVQQPPPTVPTTAKTVRPAVATYWTASMDQALLYNLEAKGWRITNPALIISKARGACTAIDEEHLSVNQMIDRLVAETNGAANAYQAADDVVLAAINAYEPCFRR